MEYLFGIGVGALVLTAVCALTVFSSRNIASFMVYSDLDQRNRQTLNQMVKEFRMITGVTNYSSNSLTCIDSDRKTLIRYEYDPAQKTLTRHSPEGEKVLLSDCSRLKFTINKRNMTNGTYDFYPTPNLFECKAITVDWCCERTLLGMRADDLPQTATIVIRN